eukprot:TRINITY_DN1734_c0_g1_i1.p1 TRINITY_DN1734_c0_g1~~TRINITY_DN1734_c0_g1_i1.p1  ORF type:complete len:241 (-),score=59.63 TRINITY_DN1734_c0_g1_i1:16-738(-)
MESHKERLQDILKGKDGKEYEVIFLKEPSDEWTTVIEVPEEYRGLVPNDTIERYNEREETMLGLFYRDQKKYGFPFQVNAYCTRAVKLYNLVEEIVKRNDDKNYVIVTERSILSDKEIFTKMLVRSGTFPLQLVATYEMFWQLIAGRFAQMIKSVLFLDVSIDNIQTRIQKRNRDEENGDSTIPVDYLLSLGERYNSFEEEFQERMPFHHLDWNACYPHEVNIDEYVDQVGNCIKRSVSV